MRIAGSIITAICAVIVIVGVFLAWYTYCENSGWGEICASVSGWDTEADGIWLVLGGGALMAVCALAAFIVSVASKGGKAAVITLGLCALVGSLASIGGCIWYIVDILDLIEWVGGSIGYGFYISAAAAVVGFIFAILTAAFSKGRQDW